MHAPSRWDNQGSARDGGAVKDPSGIMGLPCRHAALLLLLLLYSVDSSYDLSYVASPLYARDVASSAFLGSKLSYFPPGPYKTQVSLCCWFRGRCRLSMKSDNVQRRKSSGPRRHSQLRHIDEIFKRDEDDSTRLRKDVMLSMGRLSSFGKQGKDRTWLRNTMKNLAQELEQQLVKSRTLLDVWSDPVELDHLSAALNSAARFPECHSLFATASTILTSKRVLNDMNSRTVITLSSAFLHQGIYVEEFVRHPKLENSVEKWDPHLVARFIHGISKVELAKHQELAEVITRVVGKIEHASLNLKDSAVMISALAHLQVQDAATLIKLRASILVILADSSSLKSSGEIRSLCAILTALSKLNLLDRDLLGQTSRLIRETDERLLAAPSISVILKTFANMAVRDFSLFRRLLGRARELEEASWTPLSLSNVLSSCNKLSVRFEDALEYFSHAIPAIAPEDFDLQSLAIILHSYSNLQSSLTPAVDRVFSHLSRSLQLVPHSQINMFTVAVTMNSFAKVGKQDSHLFRHILSGIREMETRAAGSDDEVQGVPSKTLQDSHAISNIFNAVVKLEIDDPHVLNNLISMARDIDLSYWNEIGIAQMFNALAKIDVDSRELADRLSLAVLELPSHKLSPQVVALILFGASRLGVNNQLLYTVLFARVRKMTHNQMSTRVLKMIVRSIKIIADQNLIIRVDRNLLQHMSRQVCLIPPSDLDIRDASFFCYNLFRLGVRDDSLYLHLSDVVKFIPTNKVAAEAARSTASYLHPLITLLSTFSTLDFQDPQLYRHLFSALILIPVEQLNMQDIVLLSQVVSRVGIMQDTLFSRINGRLQDILCDDGSRQTVTASQLSCLLSCFSRLQVFDVSTFEMIAEWINDFHPVEMSVEDIASLLNSFSRGPWFARSSISHEHSNTAENFQYLFAYLSETLQVAMHNSSLWPFKDIFHHHPDGTVHAHQGGDEMHLHAEDGRILRFGVKAPFGGYFVSYKRPSGLIVRLNDEDPPSTMCPLIHFAAESRSAQTIAIILSAFAKANLYDESLFLALTEAIARIDPKAFSAFDIGQLLHASAVLNFYDRALLDNLIEAAMLLPLIQFSSSVVAKIAWALAVFDVKDRRVLNWTLGMIDRTAADMTDVDLRQLHQFFFHCSRFGPVHADKQLVQLCRDSFIDRSRIATISRMQAEITETFERMGEELEEEWIHEESGYSVDIFLKGCKVMVEVDGPLHFAFKTRKALGSTKMKRRHLQESRSQGYRLLVIPYWEWNSQKMVDDVDGGGVKKVQYLKTKLESIGETRR